MRQGVVRVLGFTPTPGNFRQIVAATVAGGPCRISGFDSELFVAARQIAGEVEKAEFTSFAELAATLATHGGGRNLPLVDDRQFAEAVRYAVRSAPENTALHASRDFPGTYRRVAGVLHLLDQWQIGPAELRQAASGAPQTLADRWNALADVADSVRDSLDGLKLEGESARIRRCLAIAEVGEGFPLRMLLFCSDRPSPLQAAWVEWAKGHGAEVMLAAPSLGVAGQQAIRALANRFGVSSETVGDCPPLVASLFSGGNAAEGGPQVSIESAADGLAECEWALRRILRERAEGFADSEIGIFARHLPTYAPLLQTAALALEVPLELAITEPLAANRFIQWILQLLEGVGSPNARRALEPLSSSYARVDATVRRMLESAALDSLRFGSEAWATFADSLEDKPGLEWLAALARWRTAHTEPKTLREWGAALESIWEMQPFEAIRSSNSMYAGRDRQALQEALAAIERRAHIDRAAKPIPIEDLASELADLWAGLEISYAPSGKGVRVSSSPLALLGCRSIHALGLLEGVFPRRRSEDPVLNDEDRLVLGALTGLALPLPSSRDIARGERAHFLQLAAAASDRFHLSYATTVDDRDNVPAFYLTEVERAAGAKVSKRHHPRSQFAPPAGEATAPFDRALAAALGSPLEPSLPETLSSDEARQAVQLSPDDAVTPAELRDAHECPFQFAWRRRLKLSPTGDENRWSMLSQLPQKANLAAQADASDAERALEQALQIELDQWRGRLEPEELKYLESGSRRLMREWIRSEFAAREVWPKDPGSVVSPASFEEGVLQSEIRLDEETSVRLKGRMAAVATMGDYVVGVVQNSRRALVDKRPDQWSDSEKIEAAMYFASLPPERPGAAIEFSRSTGERTLVVRDRLNSQNLRADAKAGLKVASLDSKETKFMVAARELLRRAIVAARSHSLETNPGEHCAYCSYGELCRRSSEFGEQTGLDEAML